MFTQNIKKIFISNEDSILFEEEGKDGSVDDGDIEGEKEIYQASNKQEKKSALKFCVISVVICMS